MGRTRQTPLPAEVEEMRVRLQSWRRTRKNGDHLPKELWSEAAGLARRLGVNRVCRALGLNHTTLKEHVVEGRVATSPIPRHRSEPAQPAFVELTGDRFLGNLPAGLVMEVTRPEGERMVMRWPAGSVVDTCGLVASFIGRH